MYIKDIVLTYNKNNLLFMIIRKHSVLSWTIQKKINVAISQNYSIYIYYK